MKIIKFNEYSLQEKKILSFIKKVGDFFSIMCPKCEDNGIKTRMKSEQYMIGVPDSLYYKCPKCKHVEDLPDH